MLTQEFDGGGACRMGRDLIESEQLMGTKAQGTQQLIGLPSWAQEGAGEEFIEPMMAGDAMREFTGQSRITRLEGTGFYDIGQAIGATARDPLESEPGG